MVHFAGEALPTVAVKLPSDEAFLTTEEVLAYSRSLRTSIGSSGGEIPAVRVGRQWRFRKRDIDAWLDNQRSRPSAAEPSADQHGRVRVLVVDDEASIRELLTLALVNYDVDTAADAVTALERIRASTEYDLMIADLKMPGMTA